MFFYFRVMAVISNIELHKPTSSALGLFSEGKPNAILVTVYRIGYITITNGSVSVFEDPSNSAPKDMTQLGNYKSGFLHNDLMPSDKLPQENLFQPLHK
jgi:hypothetical protein